MDLHAAPRRRCLREVPLGVGDIERAGEVKALSERTLETTESVRLPRPLDAFGDDGELKGAREPQDRVRERPVLGLAIQVVDERLGDSQRLAG